MNYGELIAQSKPGVSADGVCCYRISPLEVAEAEEMKVMLDASSFVNDTWIDALPNSERVCLMWLPSGRDEQGVMFDAFMREEIRKGVELWKSDQYTIKKTEYGVTLVGNTKTGTECRLSAHDTSLRCYQGQRCVTCKHEVVAVLDGKWENASLVECIERYMDNIGGYPNI
jgi:hypothetical protein